MNPCRHPSSFPLAVTAPPLPHNHARYDVENHLLLASTSLGSSAYLYDGDGKRVGKAPIGQPTQPNKIYWYGMSSDPLDETDSSGSTSNSSFNEYVFFGGKRIARRDYQNNVNYYFADHLGTNRVSTNSAGTICYNADFYPFGGERILTDTCDSAYKFTGKERDSESGLDNFGARYFGSSMGRFTSPDPLLGSGRIGNPQTWNRYAYALNNPLLIVDPTGLYNWDEVAGGDFSDEDLQMIVGGKDRKWRNWAKKALQFRDQFRNALDAANEAAGSNRLSDDQQSAAQAGVDAYGTENDSNGVIVGFYKEGYGAGTRINNNDTITVMFGGSLSGDFLTATVAHEGAHVDQDQRWLRGGEGSNGDLNHYQADRAAWAVGSYIAQALGMKSLAPHGGGSDLQVWNKGWAAADIETLRAKGVQNVLDLMRKQSSDADLLKTLSEEHHQ